MEELYNQEKNRLYKLCHEGAWDIAFICVMPAFQAELMEMGHLQEGPYGGFDFMGMPVMLDYTVEKGRCFELILRSGKCSPKRF